MVVPGRMEGGTVTRTSLSSARMCPTPGGISRRTWKVGAVTACCRLAGAADSKVLRRNCQCLAHLVFGSAASPTSVCCSPSLSPLNGSSVPAGIQKPRILEKARKWASTIGRCAWSMKHEENGV
eukprot:scaffold645_cov247-Pinguiococcus_pyrenoidosus.AAC.6